MSVNTSVVLGFVGADPETHTFEDGGKASSFSVATKEEWKDKKTGEPREHTDWHRISVRGGLAGVVEKYVEKGMKVYIEGMMRTRKYTDSSKVERYVTEIHAKKIEMLSKSSNASQDGQDNQDGQGDYAWYEEQSKQMPNG